MTQAFRIVTRIQDLDDFSGVLTNDEFISYDAALQKFKLKAITVQPGGLTGQLQYNNSGNFGGVSFSDVSATGNLLTLNSILNTDTPLTIKAATSQSALLTKWVDVNNNILCSISSNGTITTSGNITMNGGNIINDPNSSTHGFGHYRSVGNVFYARSSVGYMCSMNSSSTTGFVVKEGYPIGWSAWAGGLDSTPHTSFFNSSTGVVQFRSSSSPTTAQTFELFNTYASSTNGEFIRLRGVAGSNFEFGPSNGSVGGTLRGLTIGGYVNGSSTITPWLTFNNAGAATFVSTVTINGSTLSQSGGWLVTTSPMQLNGGIVTIGQAKNGFPSDVTAISPTIGSVMFGTDGAIGWSGNSTSYDTKTLMVGQGSSGQFRIRGDNGLSIRNLANTADAALTCGAITASTVNIDDGSTFGILNLTTVAGRTGQIKHNGTLVAQLTAYSSDVTIYKPTTFTGLLTVDTICSSAFSHSSRYIYLNSSAVYASTINMGLGLISNPWGASYISSLSVVDGTNAQTFQVYGTYTSFTSNELIRLRGVAGANFEFGPSNGSAGGTLRGLTIGGYANGSSTITPWLTFTNAGIATFSNSVVFPTSIGDSATISGMTGIDLTTVNCLLFRQGGTRWLGLRSIGAVFSNAGGIGFAANGASSAFTSAVYEVSNGWRLQADSGLSIRNLANTADAALTCGAITASGAIVGVGTIGNSATVSAMDGFDFSTTAGTVLIRQGGSRWIGFKSIGTVFSNAGGIGFAANGSASAFTSVVYEVSNGWRLQADNGLSIRNLANSADAAITAGAATFSGAITVGSYTDLTCPNGIALITDGNRRIGLGYSGRGIQAASSLTIGFASTSAIDGSASDAYFCRNSASSIGVKGAAGIDGSLTCGAITASGTVNVTPKVEVIFSGTTPATPAYGSIALVGTTFSASPYIGGGLCSDRLQGLWFPDGVPVMGTRTSLAAGATFTPWLVFASTIGVGGQTSSFPGFNASGTTFRIRLADNSADAPLSAGAITASGQFTNSQGTLTSSAPLSLTQTWNSGATTFIGVLINITDTTSASASLLQDWQVGGSSLVRISKAGTMTFANSGAGLGAQQLAGPNWWIYSGGTFQSPLFNCNGWFGMVDGANGGMQFYSGHGIVWSGTGTSGALTRNSMSGDVGLYRDGAGILGLRYSTTAQTFRVYNTYVSSTNAEWFQQSWISNEARIGTAVGSAGGTQRNIIFGGWDSASAWIPKMVIIPTSTGAIYFESATAGSTRGQYAIDLQLYRSSSSQIAGDYNVAIGTQCTSSGGAGSVAIGRNISVTDSLGGSVGIGRNITLTGYRAVGIGSGITAVTDSLALGLASYANHAGAICLMGSMSRWAGQIIWDGSYSQEGVFGASYNLAYIGVHSGGREQSTIAVRTTSNTLTTLQSIAVGTGYTSGSRQKHKGILYHGDFVITAMRSDGACAKFARRVLVKSVADAAGSTYTFSVLQAETIGTDISEISGAAISFVTTAGTQTVDIKVQGEPSYSCTGSSATNIITATGHPFANDDIVVFLTLTGGSSLQANPSGFYYVATYKVINVSGNTFQLATPGSSTTPLALGSDITSGTIARPIIWTKVSGKFAVVTSGY